MTTQKTHLTDADYKDLEAAEKLWKRFDAAFSRVSAYAVILNGEYVARVCIKHPASGGGRLTAYLQVWGYTPVIGTACGGGYDKATAAVTSAASKLTDGGQVSKAIHDAFIAANGGENWPRVLEDAGFKVLNVI